MEEEIRLFTQEARFQCGCKEGAVRLLILLLSDGHNNV